MRRSSTRAARLSREIGSDPRFEPELRRRPQSRRRQMQPRLLRPASSESFVACWLATRATLCLVIAKSRRQTTGLRAPHSEPLGSARRRRDYAACAVAVKQSVAYANNSTCMARDVLVVGYQNDRSSHPVKRLEQRENP